MKDQVRCFCAGQDGDSWQGPEGRVAHPHVLAGLNAPVMPPRKGTDVARTAVHGVNPKPSTEVTPNRINCKHDPGQELGLAIAAMCLVCFLLLQE